MHRTQRDGELELKFDLSGDAAKKVRHHALLAEADHHTRSQESVYFDTDDRDVHKAGYSLRVRRVGDQFIQTIKTNGGAAGLFDRGEWEAPVEQMAPDAEALDWTPLGKLTKFVSDAAPLVCSDVERTTWLIKRDDSMIEVVLDSATVSAGDLQASFNELELELKAGDAAAIFAFAQELGRDVPLQVGVLSKEQRGLMLAEGSLERPHKASSLDIRKSMDAGQALALIIHECIRHFRLNEAQIIAARDPEALHQARVAMRRLRSAFSLFRPAIRQGSLDQLEAELRAFIAPFGDARNLDVFLDHHGDDYKWRDRRKLKAARANAYDQVIATLGEQRTRDLFLDLVAWTASGDWRKDAASAPVEEFAVERLDAVWGKVRHRGARIADLDEHQLHRLRIGIKKLRYAVEFLSPLYARKRVRKYVSSLEKMQDCLGLLHDDMVARQIVADLDLPGLEGTDVATRAKRLRTMETRFKQLKRVGRFWTG